MASRYFTTSEFKLPSTKRKFAFRYTFNGQEQDNEVNDAAGTSLTAEYWQYDTRLGRRWNCDPILKFSESCYSTFSGNPLWLIDKNGADTALYNTDGFKIKNYTERDADVARPKGDKTPIYIVDTRSPNYDPANPFATAKMLTYTIGMNTGNGQKKGSTGENLRSNHPLFGVGWAAGASVFEEDLLDMSGEFNAMLFGGNTKADFDAINYGIWCGECTDVGFYGLVAKNKKYDLKSRIANDGTPSYAAVVIGEWTLWNGQLMRYDDYGNILYGYYGSYLEIPTSKLLAAASLANMVDNSLKSDAARDQKMILYGIMLFKQKQKNEEKR